MCCMFQNQTKLFFVNQYYSNSYANFVLKTKFWIFIIYYSVQDQQMYYTLLKQLNYF